MRQNPFVNQCNHCAPIAIQLGILFLNDIYKFSVCTSNAYQGAVIWNSLYVVTKLCSSLYNFKCIVKYDLFADYI